MSRARDFADLAGSADAGGITGRNLIINGAMQVAQRGTQTTGVTSTGYQTCDRFQWVNSNLGTWTIDQSTDSPNGFSNSFKATATTADASPAAGDYAFIRTRFEGQNLQSLAKGTSGAKASTLSFWVKSNKTGNATVEFYDHDNNRLFGSVYSISSADTWEYKTVLVPADSTGAYGNDNGLSLSVGWWLNSGSDYTSGTVPSSWEAATSGDRNVSNLGVGGATSDYFAITGVQLEVGEQATPFEHRSFGDELARCQRYYEQFDFGNGTSFHGAAQSTNQLEVMAFFAKKRATPTIGFGTKTDFRINDWRGHDEQCNGTINVDVQDADRCRLQFQKATANLTTGYAGYINRQTGSPKMTVDAEL